MRRRRRKAAALAAVLCACAAGAALAAPTFSLDDLGTTADTIPGLPSPIPLERSTLPRTSVLGYPEGAKFSLKELLDEQTRTFFPTPTSTLPMADINLRVVGPGASDLSALKRAVAAAVPATFKEDSNITAHVVAVTPGDALAVRYEPSAGGAPFPGSGGDGGQLATDAVADVALALSIDATSSVHLTSPINVDYGFARLLEDRLEAALRREGAVGMTGGGDDLRILPVMNSNFLRPAAPILLRLPRQALVALTFTLALRGDPAPPPGGGARLLPFDGPRQTALLEVVDTLLTNRTGLVQAGLDGVVARAGRGGGNATSSSISSSSSPRRALRASSSPTPTASPAPPYDEVNATIFLLSASSVAGVRDALQMVLTAPDPAAVPAAGDRPMLVQGLVLEGLAVVSAAMADGDDALDEAVTRAPRFQLAALATGEEVSKDAAAARRRRVVVAVMSALAAVCVAVLVATLAILGIRSRRQAIMMGGAGKTSSGTEGAGSGGGGGTGSSAGGKAAGGGGGGGGGGRASGSSQGTRSVRGGLFAAMLGAGGPAVTVPPPTLRRAQPEEEGDGQGNADANANAAKQKGARPAKPQPPPSSADAEWEVDPSDLTIATRPDGTDWLLGSGGAGAVFRGTRGGVGEVAIKLLQRGTPRDRAALAAEARLLRRVSRDAGVVQFYGACLTGPCPLLVLEYMAGGDLYSAIGESASAARKAGGGGGGESGGDAGGNDRPSVQWWAAGRRLALDVAGGLHFLHSSRVRHGDLKSSNILLTAGWGSAKIGDVGLAKVLGSHTTAAAGGGTYAYAAPEVLLNARCDERSDVWSFGVLLWELCTLGRPERGAMRPVAVPAEAPACIAALIESCMANDPDARPTAKQAYDAIVASPTEREG